MWHYNSLLTIMITMHNQHHDHKFTQLIAEELKNIENRTRSQLNEGLSPSVLKSLKSLTFKNPKILEKVGGLNSVVRIVKRNIEDDHSKIIKEFIVKSITHYSQETSIREALKTCINKQYSEYHGWHPGPIRFYVPFRDNTPFINKDGKLLTGSSTERQTWNQFDASWLWNDHCVYLWHRWVDKIKIQEQVYKELNLLNDININGDSLYGDYPAIVLCIIHGPLAPKMKMPKGFIVSDNPWALNNTMSNVKDLVFSA